jgi:cation diffusion facilitator CzcD-associated flavoprotein CzcO
LICEYLYILTSCSSEILKHLFYVSFIANKMPSRTPAFPIADLPGSFPAVSIPDNVDHVEVASTCVEYLSSLKPEHLIEDALWRDLLALTGTLRTFSNSKSIVEAWTELSSLRQPTKFSIVPESSRVTRFGPKTAFIAARFSFSTESPPAAGCSGLIRLVPGQDGQWKIWILTTILEEVSAFGNPDVLEISGSVSNGVSDLEIGDHRNGTSDTNGLVPNGHTSELTQFDCVIVGGGMAGLSVAGRLKALGVSAVTLERNAQIGQNWTLRYDSVKLHTCKEYGHLPFGRTFPPEDPYFLAAKDLARGFQRFVDQYNINVWLSTSVESASWDNEARSWTVNMNRKGQKTKITTRHVVFAIGAGGQIPEMPEYPHQEEFEGIVMHSATYKGKKGVIIGTGNTAHDVADDMLLAGLSSVTMVQRNATGMSDRFPSHSISILSNTRIHILGILPISYYRHFFDPLYNATVNIETADREALSLPISIIRLQACAGVRALASQEPERFDALERVNFKTDRFPDLYKIILERAGGHYLDVGVSQKICDGLIKIKSDAAPVQYTKNGLRFNDGSELEADVIIFCTGFEGNMRLMVEKIVGDEIAEKLEDFWHVDKEGELLGAWKPIGRE